MNLVNLVGDMKGVFVGPFEYSSTNGDVSVRVGDLAEGAGSVLMGADGSSPITVSNGNYPLPEVFAGRSTKARVNLSGLSYESDGSGMWTGPFELKG